MTKTDNKGEVLDFTKLTSAHNSEIEKTGELNFISGEIGKLLDENMDLIALNISKSLEIETQEPEIEEVSDSDINLVVNQVLSAVSSMSQAQYKGSPFIEGVGIDQVQNILAKSSCSSEIKSEIENELQMFEENIKVNYKKMVNEYNYKIMDLEKQIKTFEMEKQKIVDSRTARLLWPFNAETRYYDNNIFNLKCKIKNIGTKLEELLSMKPMAREQDLIDLDLKLKQKFVK